MRGPLAIVTSYRYFDDITVFSTVDLGAGRIVKVEAAQHLRTALSDEEFEEAKALAREQSEEVKALYEKFGDKLTVYPQFSQFTVKDDPRIHRVVHLTYRVGKRDLSYPRPQVDLTTREVATPAPEVVPEAPPARPVNEHRLNVQVLRGSSFRPVRDEGTSHGFLGSSSRSDHRAPGLDARSARGAGAAVLPSGTCRSARAGGDGRVPGQRVGRPGAAKGTAWKVHFARGLHKGLYITGAWFKRDLSEDWIKVSNDARIAELFVPYHQSSNIRYFDLTGFSFPMAEVKAEDAGPFGNADAPVPGRPLSRRWSRRFATAAWRGKTTPTACGAARELVIWGALEAGNYMYIMSYALS